MPQHPFSGSSGIAKRDRLAAEVGARDGYQCFMCGTALYPGRKASNSRVLEHLEPWRDVRSKAYDPNNLKLCCKRCHDTHCQSIEAQYPGDPNMMRQAKLMGQGFTDDGKPRW